MQNKVKDSLEALLVVEKQTRVAEDLDCSKQVCTAILEVAHASGDWKQLLDHIVMLAKRRGQLKDAIVVRSAPDMKRHCMLIPLLSLAGQGTAAEH